MVASIWRMEKIFWSWHIALKIKLFLWLALENKILTWDTLLSKGWEGPSYCLLCTSGPESVSHILINCVFTRQVWSQILKVLNLRYDWEGTNLKIML
jgi:hypothetical protein